MRFVQAAVKRDLMFHGMFSRATRIRLHPEAASEWLIRLNCVLFRKTTALFDKITIKSWELLAWAQRTTASFASAVLGLFAEIPIESLRLPRPETSAVAFRSPFRSNDIPSFYHRLHFSGGETEVRAHHKGFTAVHNSLPERGTTSLRVSNGKVLVNSFFLDKNLVSCRLETDPVEIAEFYRSLTDDFNCAEQKKAESSAAERNDFDEQRSTSSKSTRENSRRRIGNIPRDSFEDFSSSVPEDEPEFSEEFDGNGAGTAREPLWCSIEDPIGRQIWNETFALIVNGSDQRELIQEIRKLLRFRVSISLNSIASSG